MKVRWSDFGSEPCTGLVIEAETDDERRLLSFWIKGGRANTCRVGASWTIGRAGADSVMIQTTPLGKESHEQSD